MRMSAAEPMHSQKLNGVHSVDVLEQIRKATEELNWKLICAGVLLAEAAPEREWAVVDLIPRRDVTLFGGDGGLGKSTLVGQLAIAAALGCAWLGYDVKQSRVLVLSCEDDEHEMHFRYQQIVEQEARYDSTHSLDALRNLLMIDGTKDLDPTLAIYSSKTQRLEPTPFFHAVKKLIDEEGIEIFIVDSAADVFAEELVRHAVRSFIRLLRSLDCAVILIAHPSVSGMQSGRGYSGSTHWNNSVRSRLYMTRATTADGEEPDPDLRILELAKSNRAKAGNKIHLRWQKGRFVTETEIAHSIDALARDLKAEQKFIDLLRLFNDQNQPVSASRNQTFAPMLFAKHPDADGFDKRTLERAMQKLLTADKVQIVESGPPSRRYSKLVVRGAQQ